VGAVLVNAQNIIIGTGYNGTRANTPGCLSGACPRGLLSYSEVEANSDYSNPSSPGYCISSHAEINCMQHVTGPVQGATMYVSRQPCPGCEKALFNAGLARVVWPDGEFTWI
jgi:dCMP deaminase